MLAADLEVRPGLQDRLVVCTGSGAVLAAGAHTVADVIHDAAPASRSKKFGRRLVDKEVPGVLGDAPVEGGLGPVVEAGLAERMPALGPTGRLRDGMGWSDGG